MLRRKGELNRMKGMWKMILTLTPEETQTEMRNQGSGKRTFQKKITGSTKVPRQDPSRYQGHTDVAGAASKGHNVRSGGKLES